MIMTSKTKQAPLLLTELPGPNARKLIENDEHYTSPSYTRFYPLAVERGEGAVIEDVDGNLFLDFTAGIAVCATGHCHPRVVEAIHQQAQKLIHMSGTDFYYGPQAKLANKLADLAPGSSPKRVFFTNSGAESVEAAFKLARYHTKREKMIAFFGAFHGRTMGALSLTGSKMIQKQGFSPLVPGVTHIDYPNPYRCPEGKTPEEHGMDCIDVLEHKLFKKTIPPDEVAAIFVEPIQGEGGYIVPPDGFLKRLKALTEKHDILFIADEVQAGMGRTGKMFATEHWNGIEPDIICLAKGIASGMPLGAIVAKESVMDWPPGAHASTFGGNPISCVAALETIALLEEGLLDHTENVGGHLFSRLTDLQRKHRLIGDVRGKGLMLAIELVKDRDTKEPAIDAQGDLVLNCFHKGLLLLGCGENSIRFSPPLIVDTDQIDTAVDILDEALTEIEA